MVVLVFHSSVQPREAASRKELFRSKTRENDRDARFEVDAPELYASRRLDVICVLS